MKKGKSDRGSTTIEAALIFPVIIMSVIALILSFMLLSQKVLLSKTAALAAQQGAEIWISGPWAVPAGYPEDGAAANEGSLDSHKQKGPGLGELYYQLADLGRDVEVIFDLSGSGGNPAGDTEGTAGDGLNSRQKDKFREIMGLVEKELSRGVLKPEGVIVKFRFENEMLERRLKVTLEQEVSMLSSEWINSFFNRKGSIILKGSGISVISEPAEYIRNIDLLTEYASRAGDKLKLKFSFEDLMKKFGGVGQ